MAHSIVLHIGPRKTGSTFLQRALTGIAPELASAGILYPTLIAGVQRHNHVAPTYAVPGARDGRSIDRWADVGPSVLNDFVRQVTVWDGPVIISSEALGGMTTSGIRDFLSHLPEVPITVIATIRALPSVVLSSWAQHVRNMHRESLRSYIERRIEERRDLPADVRWEQWDTDPHQTFWRSYDYPGLLTRWSRLGVTTRAVIVPPSHAPATELWSRFRRATALDALPIQAPQIDEVGANTSMRIEELEVIRHVAKHAVDMGLTDADLTPLRGHRWMPADHLRPPEGSRPGLNELEAKVLQEWATSDVAALESLDIEIVGDVSDLVEPGRSSAPADARLYAESAGYLVADYIMRDDLRRSRRFRRWFGRWRRKIRHTWSAVKRRILP